MSIKNVLTSGLASVAQTVSITITAALYDAHQFLIDF
jgi:hypothetical protein